MYFLKSKDQQLDAFKAFKARAERQLNTTLKCIRSDRGTEFFNKAEKKYLEDLGIEHQSSLPYSQQQNGRAERFQQTILNKADSLRHQAGLSEGFWKFAVMAAIYIYNRTPFARADWKTPYELWFRNQPNVSRLRVFGCQAYVHILKEKRSSKLSAKAKEMIFIGYLPSSKGYYFWDPKGHVIVESRDVVFDKSHFPNRKDLPQEKVINISTRCQRTRQLFSLRSR